MLVKRTTKNQITLPKEVVREFPDVTHFEVEVEGERIVLKPLRRSRAEEVRAKLADIGIEEGDIADAVAWARSR